MDKLAKSLPKGVAVHYIPAAFSPAWEPFARAFYAARKLGVLKATHDELFKAKFTYNYPVNSLNDLADFYARHGVNRAAFLRAAKSPATTRQMAADQRLIRRWGVDATPTIVVDGKYRSHRIHSLGELVSLTQWLVKRELKRDKN
jgi:thiol:disulfide interchange protein DsbA